MSYSIWEDMKGHRYYIGKTSYREWVKVHLEITQVRLRIEITYVSSGCIQGLRYYIGKTSLCGPSAFRDYTGET